MPHCGRLLPELPTHLFRDDHEHASLQGGHQGRTRRRVRMRRVLFLSRPRRLAGFLGTPRQ
eukprot:7659966-Lingulodinium_polyedra.AAC.1